jgi:hypothetical protein
MLNRLFDYSFSWMFSNVKPSEEPAKISCGEYLYINDNTSIADVKDFLVSNTDSICLKFIVLKNTSTFLLCYLILDILELLSNDSFFSTRLEIYTDELCRGHFITDFKEFIKNNIIQRSILPIYAKFIIDPVYGPKHRTSRIGESLNPDSLFDILFIKEELECITIQRINFRIDL